MSRLLGPDLIRELAERHPGVGHVLATGYAELSSGAEGVTRRPMPFTQSQLRDALTANA